MLIRSSFMLKFRIFPKCHVPRTSLQALCEVFLFLILLTPGTCDTVTTFNKCGGKLQEEKGTISSPNFPKKFPTPISCRWVIEAPKGKGIALFFTQFYMKEGLKATEYYYYSNRAKMHRKDIGNITFRNVHIETRKPIIVLEFDVKHISNVHLRVEDYFTDVFGFNITYEFINEGQVVRNDTCSVSKCSFLGNCFASYGFIEYKCKCFDKFIGDSCQYGPACNPSRRINSCLNGGKCRYYMGTKANTCDCPHGYTGAKCQIREKVSKECSLHGCSQTCKAKKHGETKCACYNGFELSKRDNKTCLDTGKTRYLASIKLTNLHASSDNIDFTLHSSRLFESIKSELLKLFRPSLKVRNLTILSLGAGAVIEFHFFGEKQDSTLAKSILYKTVSQGNLGPHLLDKNFVKFEIEPALQLQDVELNKNTPYVVGDNMVIACGAVGSSSMRVTWLKDSALIDIHRAVAYRDIKNVTYRPTTSEQKYYFELIVDAVTIHDSGLFTCEITDWGVTQNKSIEVNVDSPPEVSVTPMSVTLEEGGTVTLKCMENVFRDTIKFSYLWSKNGKVLKESGDIERIEDLYPGGSWLHISSVKNSAVYACTVNSNTGITRRNVYVHVLSKYGDIKTCPAQKKYKTMWEGSASNNFDIQPCPSGYFGDARRLCEVIHKGPPVWQTPDFSECKSFEFTAIENRFETLKLGYMMTDATKILDELWRLMKNQKTFYPGEGEPIVHMLSEVVDYLEKHSRFRAEVLKVSTELMDIFETILSKPVMLQKQVILIELHNLIKRQAAFQTSMLEPAKQDQEFMEHYGMENWKLDKNPKQGFIYLRMPFSPPKLIPKWYNDTINLRFNIHFQENVRSTGSKSLDLSMFIYRNITALLPKRGITRVDHNDAEYQIASRIVTVTLQSGYHQLGLTPDSFKNSLKIKVRLQKSNPEVVLNATGYNLTCGLAALSGKKWEFRADKGCELTEQSSTHGTCTCDKLGTYALIMLFYDIPKADVLAVKYDYVAYMGSVVCIAFTVVTIFILTLSYRKIKGPITLLKIQMCLAVLGAEASILHAVRQSITEDQFPYIITAAQFFVIATFSLHFCIALQIFVDFVKMKQLQYASFKIILVGWGFPMIIVGATLAAQEMEGFNLKSWWVVVESNYFYGLVVPIIIMTVLQILLHLIVKSEIRRHFYSGPKVGVAHRRARLLTRLLFTLLALILMSISSVMYINFEQDIFKYFFALCSSILGSVLCICFALKSEENASIMSSCKRHEREDLALEAVSRRSSKIDFKGLNDKYPAEICLDDVDIEFTKKQNEGLRKMDEKISRDDGFGDTLDMKKELLDRISNHTGKDHHIPGSPAVAALTPDVIEIKGTRNPHDYYDYRNSVKTEMSSRHSDQGDSRSASPFELQLLDNSPRSSIYRPRSRGAPSPNPWDILDPTQNEIFKCSDSDSYQADMPMNKPCPLHSHVSNQSSDISQSDNTDSTTSSIDYVSHSNLQRKPSPYNNPMAKLLTEDSSSESEEDISEATVKHRSKSPSPQKSLTSPSKIQTNCIGRLSEDPAILAYATSPKKRRAANCAKPGNGNRSDPGQSPKNATAV